MNACIITVGDELLIGQILNTNSAWIAQKLNELGIQVKWQLTIGDEKKELFENLTEFLIKSDIIIITGGLGPTSDDITKPTLCEFFNSRLIFNKNILEHVEKFVVSRGGILNELNKSQAYVPDNAITLFNPIGTAPGLWFNKNDKTVIAMPGVPFEMEKMMTDHVIPLLKSHCQLSNIFHRTINTQGIPEARLAEMLNSWEKSLPNKIKVAYLPSPGMVRIRLSLYDADNEDLLKKYENELHKIIGNNIWGYDNDSLEKIIGALLLERNKTLATAESCTGGNISKTIVSVPGSSRYFIGGIVAYSNDIKINQLGVNEDIIKKYGAVSKEVVEMMVANVIKKFKSDYGIAVSGIAGPDGGTVEKPVGTVYISVGDNNKVLTQKFNFADNRERNIIKSTYSALNMLRMFINSN